MRGYLLLLAGCATMAVGAQGLSERNALIGKEYEAEHYTQVVRLIDLQLKEAVGTTWQDSTQLYLYKYGRAVRKLKGADAGVSAAERIYTLVQKRGNAANELNALFDLSWTYYDVGRLKDCARVDSMAVRVADSDPSIPPSQRGRARQYLAFDYSVLGDHRSSEKYARQALAEYAKADSIPPAQWAESYTAVGVALWHMGLVRDAERNYMKALDALGNDTTERILARKVTTYGNLGVLWQNAGDFVRSKNYYNESLLNSDRIISTTKDPFVRDEAIVNRSRTYLNLATVYHQYGDEGRARELLELAWADRSAVLEPDDPQLLAVQERMADIELSAGALEKAEELIEEYVVACEKKFGRKSEEYIRACSKMGDIAMRRGKATQADSLFRISIAAGRLNAEESTDVVLAGTLQSRAQMEQDAGRMDAAVADLQQAREILVKVNGPVHYTVAKCDVLLAQACFRKGDMEKATALARSALELLQDRVQALKANELPQSFPAPELLPEAIYWKVRAERAWAGPEITGKAWNEDIDLAIRSLARNKSAMRDEASKLLLIGARRNLFELALDLAYEEYAITGKEMDLERFINISEADRSILLKDRLNGFAGIRFAGVPDSVIDREQELYAALDLDAGDRSTILDLPEREKAYSDFLAVLERDHPDYFKLRYGEPHITLADIRGRLLNPERQVLAYTRTGSSLYAWVVDLEVDTLVRLEHAGIREAVKALNTMIMAREAAPYANASYNVYQLAVAPMQLRLSKPELLIIPDGALHDLNFEVLLTAPDVKDFGKNLLIQRYTIAYLLSATTALQFSNINRKHSKGILAIAPGFNDQLKQDYLSTVKDPSNVDQDYLHFVRQPFAERTAQTLGSTLSATVMTGKAASEHAFREKASRYGILHLGTHAELNASAPMYSRLVLSKAGGELEPDDDGYLHAYEIYELDLRAQLAVLTACATGTGKQDAGEGVRSLGYGFAYAGCPSMVVSLWNIDEKVSAEIIANFYANLAEGMPKHKALRQAKLSFLAHAPHELSLPYYWAGLVLVGDVEPVALSSAKTYLWIVTGGVLLILMGWYVGKRVRDRVVPNS